MFVLSGLLARNGEWTFRSLARDLHVPVPTVQRALGKTEAAGLYRAATRQVHRAGFEEFAIHGLRYIAPAPLGPIVPGMPAAWAAEPMAGLIVSSGQDPPPAWPDAEGKIRGQQLEPLHRSAGAAVAEWHQLGELLALLDSIRAGDPRIRSIASEQLAEFCRRPDRTETAL